MGADNTPDIEIRKLLAELQDADAYRRGNAVEAIGEKKISDERLSEALQELALNDPDSVVRESARTALTKLGIEPPGPKVEPQPPPLTRNEKIFRFLVGFLGWYAVNGLLWYLVGNPNEGENFILLLCSFPANVLALLVLSLAKRTRLIGFGVLAAVALNLLISLILGVLQNAFCFVPFYLK